MWYENKSRKILKTALEKISEAKERNEENHDYGTAGEQKTVSSSYPNEAKDFRMTAHQALTV